ncbi:MAG: LptF/LptG family permease [Verrucomicrobia bacterium]|nr:LptF/LptG family permease [Verrucomicrobiota bacterium]MBU4248669.1 LptF/LptG family permease [Verrucomicrobiota bacterium]MBU4289694.1 LptF/LptG family permease [Verrucomicrobiota bacterium]MBU4496427.1 LptF/LptG family permease [Verrucomicrobiota bacterium]MCG2678809.1 LptF/LptG family permease [Kiritimatiellia bacterium]
MKLMDKYILRQFFVPLGYCLLTFTMVFVIFDLFEHLSEFIEAKTPLYQVVRYYFMIIPALLVYIAPISLLLGLLYSLWHLTKNNELTAMRASGISLTRIAVPIIGVGLCFSLIVTVFQETLAPWTSYWAEQFIRQQELGDTASMRYAQNLPYNNERDHRFWIIRKFDLQLNNMQGIKVVQQRPDGSDLETIRAEEGRYYDGRWWFFKVTNQKYDYYNNPVGPVETLPIRQMANWGETPDDFINEVKDPMFLSALELRNFMITHKNLSAKTYSRISVDIHSRLAMPWTCLVVTLFGVPCGLHTARKGAFMGLIVALLTFFCFYLLMTFCQWLGKNEILDPVISAWLPNTVFILIGFFLMARAR